MKKISASFLIIFCIGLVSLGVYAADLKFTPDGGGKYIYCNNQEFITREQLADYGLKPSYIMTGTELEKGKYTLYFSHINRTELKHSTPYDPLDAPQDMTEEEKSYYSDIKYPGFAIEVDACFKAREDTEIKITALGFEVQKPRNYYYTNRLINYEDSWGCLNAVCDYFKTPIYTQGSEYKYEPKSFKEKTFTVKKGETVWLSDYIDGYEAVGWLKPVHLLCDFEILHGETDIKIAAVRSYGTLGDRSGIKENAADGRYIRDGQYKGIADSLPSVTAPLEFEIDDTTEDAAPLPVTVYNQYTAAAGGAETTEWLTHINPQNDRSTVRTAAESDLLTLKYYDPEKAKLYSDEYEGERNEGEENSVWIFNPFYSDTREGGNPNFPLDTSKYNVKKSASLANYCVRTNYDIKITNSGEKTRYFNYNAKCTSNLLAYISENGTPQKPYITAKGYSDTSRWDTLCTKELPAGETAEFTLTVFLPINYTGGIHNTFTITDSETPISFYEDLKQGTVRDPDFTGKNYVRYANGNFYVSDSLNTGETVIPADEDVKKIFALDQNAYRILYYGGHYFVMYKDFAETPAFYSNMTKYVSSVYVLDENFKLCDTLKFKHGFPYMLSYAGGKVYIRSDKTRMSEDLKHWKAADFFDEGGFSLPLDNGSGVILLPKTGGDTYLSPDGGENYYKISFPEGGKPPRYIDCFGDLYFYAEGSMLYTSSDGISWDSFDAGEKITSLSREGGEFIINKTAKYTPNVKPLKKQMILNSELISFDGETRENPSDLLVPSDELLERAGIEHSYSKDKRTLTIKTDEKTIELHAGSNAVITKGSHKSGKSGKDEKEYMDNTCILSGGTLLIPAADVFSALGCSVSYIEASKCFIINKN